MNRTVLRLLEPTESPWWAVVGCAVVREVERERKSEGTYIG
jgi:hypothetical protein